MGKNNDEGPAAGGDSRAYHYIVTAPNSAGILPSPVTHPKVRSVARDP